MTNIVYAPSIMCGNLTNLEESLAEIKAVGIDTLHVDIIDGTFSPSMPLGLDTVKKIRETTDLKMDVHIMSVDNEYFVSEVADMGVDNITFHYETSLHSDRYIQMIKKSQAKVGIALNPATSLSMLEFILPQVDRVCLMLINPGFATDKNEKQISYAATKIKRLKQMIDEQNLQVEIQVDGRVSLKKIPELIQAGATNLVLGSTSLFIKGNSLQENKNSLDEIVASCVKAEAAE